MQFCEGTYICPTIQICSILPLWCPQPYQHVTTDKLHIKP